MKANSAFVHICVWVKSFERHCHNDLQHCCFTIKGVSVEITASVICVLRVSFRYAGILSQSWRTWNSTNCPCEIECKCVHLAMFKVWNRLENCPDIFLSPSSDACWEKLVEQGGSCDTAAQIKFLAFVGEKSWPITDTSLTLLLLINYKWAWVLPVTSKPPNGFCNQNSTCLKILCWLHVYNGILIFASWRVSTSE